MPKYLFTSDQRISELPDRIKQVSTFILNGHDISEIVDKSDNNNSSTLKFYYNLHPGTETCSKSSENPIFGIRNFILKFQYPNTRTQESMSNSLGEKTLFAPFRSVVTILYLMAIKDGKLSAWISLNEILYYLFCNPYVYKNPLVDYNKIIDVILKGRKQSVDLTSEIESLIEWKQYGRQSRELFIVLTYASSCFKLSNGIISFSLNSDSYENDKEFIDQILGYSKFWYPSNPSNFNLSNLEYISYMDTANTPYNVIDFSVETVEEKVKLSHPPLQQIFYGAPGTGKSHTIDGMTNEKNSIRTTFHPDSDYASFVGAYKPMMDKVPVPEFNDKDKKPINEENKIVYKYEPQVFLKAYVEAWKRYLNRIEGEDDSYYLVIEEINRGNCAQIFGDIFQLLDRDENTGFSSYAISSDSAIAKYLAEDAACENSKFSELNFSDVTKNCDGVTKVIATADDLKSGKKLVLPPNLFIWATMNTSDQSLFPMDSAFKRRWEWVYVPIGQPESGKKERKWKIKADGLCCYWWEFLQAINKKIEDTVDSEDKQLGYFFAKPADGEVIDAKTFVNKVIFYLWNDALKDEDCDCFVYKKLDGNWDAGELDVKENEKIGFRKFFKSREEVDEKLVCWFINNLLKDEEVKLLDDNQNESDNSNEIAYMRQIPEKTNPEETN